MGIQKLDCENDQCKYLITWAIYKEPAGHDDFIGNLSFDLPTQNAGQLIGFLRFIKTIK